ncbi:C4-dicarboxylate ABC transporter permease [Sporanaerobium hydrogeniformans]|uniref:C4-dicarboxylate ABC transporter permease n=1 Tax=Sporanaerobium hydrogeniformans TaxID=3072179 RepID=A0AC61DB63_9FIRM|nr:TRAP transporter small permease [Sporanaerobium hydrogeniformans]PHV70003.1 C4-dicarboxylate ABC transporter permease [Sporanaerobium hydrogeniformans]
MQTIRNILDKGLGAICAILFVFMTVVGTYQIVTRYVFNSPSTVSEELLTYSFTWMAILAAALVFGIRDHMRMSFFADKFTGKKAIYLSLFSEVLVFIFSAVVLVYGGINITRLTLTQVTASLGIPMGYVYMVVPIAGIIILIYNVLNMMDIVGQLNEGRK